MALRFDFLTLFPEVYSPFLNSSLMGKARQKGLVDFNCVQIRDFATDKHRTVDDTPYGGGPGMILRVDVLYRAWESCGKGHTILMSPQGPKLTQERAKELATCYDHLIVVAGHYEGVDERFIELVVGEEISIGDYVLTGGELPSLVLADVVTRLIPGVVGKEDSVTQDSLEGGLLKYPQYTRPPEFMGCTVPEILTSGDHGEIAKWRAQKSAEVTARKRPDLLGR